MRTRWSWCRTVSFYVPGSNNDRRYAPQRVMGCTAYGMVTSYLVQELGVFPSYAYHVVPPVYGARAAYFTRKLAVRKQSPE